MHAHILNTFDFCYAHISLKGPNDYNVNTVVIAKHVSVIRPFKNDDDLKYMLLKI